MDTELEHVVIRRHEFFAGTTKNPKAEVFVQTDKSKFPLDEKKLEPNQIVWMKWSGGPIVAEAKILSWNSGRVVNSNINEIRNLTIGTKLFGLNNYWEEISKKEDFFYTVIRLKDEEWLEKLIYPEVRGYGKSWVYLNTKERKKEWLSNYIPPKIEITTRRSIPDGLRFHVFRRDESTCIYCGKDRDDEIKIELDHIIPWSVVKKHEFENLVVSCKECNRGKSNLLLTESELEKLQRKVKEKSNSYSKLIGKVI